MQQVEMRSVVHQEVRYWYGVNEDGEVVSPGYPLRKLAQQVAAECLGYINDSSEGLDHKSIPWYEPPLGGIYVDELLQNQLENN